MSEAQTLVPNAMPPWKQVAAFEGRGFVVIVSVQYGLGRPRYSLEIGRRHKEDRNKILHHIGLLVDDSKLREDSPEIEFLNDPIELANLIEDAGNWIRDQLERSRKEWLNNNRR
jgi:hypothetical protein